MKCSECRWSRSSPPEDPPMFCVHPDHMVLDSRGRTKTHTSHWNARGECLKYTSRRIRISWREAMCAIALAVVTGAIVGLGEGLVGGLYGALGALLCALVYLGATLDT